MAKTPSDVLSLVEGEGYEFVDLRFCDLPGQVQHFTIPAHALTEDGFSEGYGFDGSSIEGFSRIQESDMIAIPDPSTFQVIPWKTETPVARMFCDVWDPDGTPFDGDPRGVLKRQLERAAEMGEYLMAQMRTLKSPLMRDLRGKGLLIALELDTARVTARTACEVFLRHGILTKDTHQTVLRFAPPLVITREEIDEAMQGIRAALAALDADSK